MILLLTLLLAVTSGWPSVASTVLRGELESNFIGRGTSQLAVSILQDQIKNRTNFVFSPLGHSVILSILAEGCRGPTRDQLISVLSLPADLHVLRSSFKSLLSNMQERDVLNQPEFRNWFYVYKNCTVLEDYKNILEENYLTTVKEIEPLEPIDLPSTSSSGADSSSTTEAAPDNSQAAEAGSTDNSNPAEAVTDNSKPAEAETADKSSSTEADKSSSTTDKSSSTEVGTDTSSSSSSSEQENRNLSDIDVKSQALEKEISRALKGEIEKEILTALSANRLSSPDKRANKEPEDGERPESRMIIFNALYFRGRWASPFHLMEEPCQFHGPSAISTVCIQSEGEFETGKLPSLKASAIELPYENGRYSLLVVLPDVDQPLDSLISGLSEAALTKVNKQLSKRPVRVQLPKFKFYTISRPRRPLQKEGITDIFTEQADLSGITGTKELYLDDLVQLVNVEVDEGSAAYNWLDTTSVVNLRSPLADFIANRPFLYFLRDRIDNLIVVSGKLENPSINEEEK